ncbi:MAG: tRNA (N6-isopentenyl adenosine(37)-C2)-methylthiotransferase MiaB [Bacteroidales bacterium]|nr:tRNA (N6-isopentenyl adenosine(37)-C2)-methylthiotransferase MiaB [Bacteroidales bacterium]MBQ9597731.1 tRNA (N6-isopentenyl adenosine(37)-C2)-methylthiotransferase MiaB [Bacteroidales bacterium]
MNLLRPLGVDAPHSRRVYIETYGCQMNFNDSEVVLSILQKAGYRYTERMEEADVILANTCSIRDNAEQRILGRIEQFAFQKRKRKGVLVGILGCMAERLKEELLENSAVDLVVGPDCYRRLPELLECCQVEGKGIDTLLSREETYADVAPVRLDKNGVNAFISIMRGCNNVCSYCVVPYTRGVERSRESGSIVREACQLFENGYREVTLLGQNVDSYRWTAPDGTVVDFADLLAQVAAVNPLLRVRFSTSYPSDISDKLLDVMASRENICHHIHLPVQSGSDRMLEKMRRKYDRAWYLERVRTIREKIPGCGLTTDIIAGFCSETEEDHRDTLSLMEEVGFDSAFMFQYSERPGTLAARHYPDDVLPEVKTRRLNEIIALQMRKSEERYAAQVGTTQTVLIEGPAKRGEGSLCGRASNYMMCVFPGNGHHAGEYVRVHINAATPATLIGEIVE